MYNFWERVRFTSSALTPTQDVAFAVEDLWIFLHQTREEPAAVVWPQLGIVVT